MCVDLLLTKCLQFDFCIRDMHSSILVLLFGFTEQVEERLETLKEENTQELEKLNKEKEQVLAQMADLKKILYGKFNDSINLEED